MDCLERVGSSRLMLEGKFPYPSAVDCMRYAIQEMAEFDDARMREDQPDHKRNNERQPDARKELGQAGYMVLSALLLDKGNDYPGFMYVAPGKPVELWAAAVMNVASAIGFYEADAKEDGAVDAWYAWVVMKDLMMARGWDPMQLITETCEAFEAKHLGVQA